MMELLDQRKLREFFDDVRKIHFLSYIRYLYFNVGRMAYLQANVLSAYVFLAPAIVAGVMTLGVMQQVSNAFSRVAWMDLRCSFITGQRLLNYVPSGNGYMNLKQT